MKDSKNPKFSRRQFGKAALAVSAVAALPDISASAGAAASHHPQQDNSEAKLPAAARAEIEAQYQNIIRKYGDRLSEEQRKRMRKILAYNQRMLIPVRAFSLQQPGRVASQN